MRLQCQGRPGNADRGLKTHRTTSVSKLPCSREAGLGEMGHSHSRCHSRGWHRFSYPSFSSRLWSSFYSHCHRTLLVLPLISDFSPVLIEDKRLVVITLVPPFSCIFFLRLYASHSMCIFIFLFMVSCSTSPSFLTFLYPHLQFSCLHIYLTW